jgi:uncharacterized protein DUF4430
VRRIALLFAGAALLTGCGAGETSGTASVWVTRDRGAKVLLVDTVPAGLTAMQALRRVAEVKTRYGGRFVQAINGLEGSLSARRDWFYFVNGYEGDRSAAEYRLHDGDIEWWDYRSWASRSTQHVPVVVGAFPEPFLHGYGGKRRPAVVVGSKGQGVRALARRLRARVLPTGAAAPRDFNVLRIERSRTTRFDAEGGTSPGDRVVFTFAGDWRELLRGAFRFRYEVGV